jgi:hypothetical protein
MTPRPGQAATNARLKIAFHSAHPLPGPARALPITSPSVSGLAGLGSMLVIPGRRIITRLG